MPDYSAAVIDGVGSRLFEDQLLLGGPEQVLLEPGKNETAASKPAPAADGR